MNIKTIVQETIRDAPLRNIDESFRYAALLTARTCAATVCNLCHMNAEDTTPGDEIKSIGPAHRLDTLNYQHSVEYYDGSQYYWVCEADKMWKELE